jgi:divinyl protochlorophyllide a 8-vinyl-reductase
MAEARIGPNAIIRVGEALVAMQGRGVAADVFAAAGLSEALRDPPQTMVPEIQVTRLHGVMRGLLGIEAARRVGAEAGRRTAHYLLGHRVPRPLVLLLPRLPAWLSARVLLRAVSKHSWTFAGSAGFSAHAARPVEIGLAGCAICRGAHEPGPLCDYYGETLAGLFRALVSRDCLAVQTSCAAAGASACRFELAW